MKTTAARIALPLLAITLCGYGVEAQKRRSGAEQKKPAVEPLVAEIDADFHFREGRFTIHFPLPGIPKEKRSELDTPFGKTESLAYYVNPEGASYSVVFFEYPVSSSDLSGAMRSFEEAVKGIRSNPENTLLLDTSFEMNGTRGTEVINKNPDGITWMRLFMIRRRAFQVSVTFLRRTGLSELSGQEMADARRFLNSFKPDKNDQ